MMQCFGYHMQVVTYYYKVYCFRKFLLNSDNFTVSEIRIYLHTFVAAVYFDLVYSRCALNYQIVERRT